MLTQFGRYRQYAPLILRVVIGIIFLAHGLQKFGVFGGGSIEGVAGFFGSIGIPLPGLMAPLVAAIEALGGLALIVGAGTRISAILLSIIMLVAIFVAKLPMGAGLLGDPSFEFDLALLGGLLALLLLGAGTASVDSRIETPSQA